MYQTEFQALRQFYSERGDYARVVQLIETERARDDTRDLELLPLLAENARLVGDTAKELEALRAYYAVFNNPPRDNSSLQANATARANARVNLTGSPLMSLASASPAALLVHYFELLDESGEAGRRELHQLTRNANAARYLLINFLLAKDEGDLAREAIENSNRPVVWKRARAAEASYMLRDFDASRENFFISALRDKTIGEMIARPPDLARELVGHDWFQLTETYGRWLYLAPGQTEHAKSTRMLPALIEERPRDASPQLALGRFYLAHKDAANALKHLTIAAEEQPANDQIIAALGSAYFLHGDEKSAEREWSKLIAGDDISPARAILYLQTLVEHNRAAIARERLAPILINYLKTIDESKDYYLARRSVSRSDVKTLIRLLAHSFERRPDKRETNRTAGAKTIDQSDEDNSDAANDEAQTAAALPPSVEAMRAAYFKRLADASRGTFLPELLITESLVGEHTRGAFYAMLIARSDKLDSYKRDTEFIALQRESLASESALEEMLDHKNDFNISEPANARMNWQREYLAYLIEEHQTNAARRLVAEIETELKGAYARPAWLRLARIKIELLENQTAQALSEIRHFVGIETAPDLLEVAPPNLKRLNDALTALRQTKHEAEIDPLIEAFHARRIALAQYDTTDFLTLARLAFKRGETKLAAQFLRLMIELGDEATRPAAEAAIAALPSVKQFEIADTRAELPADSNAITYLPALRLAAETSVEIKRFDEAISYRRQIIVAAPDDGVNRLELARLLAHENRPNEALQMLAAVICDHQQTRAARWQAVTLLPEIIGNRVELWSAFEQLVNLPNNADHEMTAAVCASELIAVGKGDDGVKMLREIETTNPNPYLIYFRLLMQQAAHQDGWSQGLVAALEASRDEKIANYAEAFGFKYDEPLRQLIRFDAENNRPLAALRLAENNGLHPAPKAKPSLMLMRESNEAVDVASSETPQTAEHATSTFPTLDERRARRTAAAQSELYGLLAAAERLNDNALAMIYERAHLASLTGEAERRASINRLRHLQARERMRAELQARLFAIDENLVGGESSDE